jgi:hypothetical protein
MPVRSGWRSCMKRATATTNPPDTPYRSETVRLKPWSMESKASSSKSVRYVHRHHRLVRQFADERQAVLTVQQAPDLAKAIP